MERLVRMGFIICHCYFGDKTWRKDVSAVINVDIDIDSESDTANI